MKVYDPDLISPDPAVNRLDNALRAVGDEVLRALDKFPPLNSPHEGYAVIAEELEELWDEAKANRGWERAARDEAIQVAAMAVRYVLDIRRAPESPAEATEADAEV